MNYKNAPIMQNVASFDVDFLVHVETIETDKVNNVWILNTQMCVVKHSTASCVKSIRSCMRCRWCLMQTELVKYF